MRNPIYAADEFIQWRVFQRIADAATSRWNLTCYRLAMGNHQASAALYSISIILQVHNLLRVPWAIGLVIALTLVVAGSGWLVVSSGGYHRAKRFQRMLEQGRAVCAPRYDFHASMHASQLFLLTMISSIGLIVPPLPIELLSAGILADLAASYFFLCIPLPPRRKPAKVPSPNAAMVAASH